MESRKKFYTVLSHISIKSHRKRIAQIVHIIVERNRCDINELGNKNIDENVPGLLKICIQ